MVLIWIGEVQKTRSLFTCASSFGSNTCYSAYSFWPRRTEAGSPEANRLVEIELSQDVFPFWDFDEDPTQFGTGK